MRVYHQRRRGHERPSSSGRVRQDAPVWIVAKANMYARLTFETPFVIYQGRRHTLVATVARTPKRRDAAKLGRRVRSRSGEQLKLYK
ncbi:hypothetical protein BD310DRAFT_573915 [Dichomitus squalens]|uniref:Uncharacterized protein n=1 Tax=Dichomitus squalens TaxID=114155 RepID=A0A4Q9PRQ5_9APHY|nr:hypothetical protein BD310DRAFT_573915 [Dichomitus squalens]